MIRDCSPPDCNHRVKFSVAAGPGDDWLRMCGHHAADALRQGVIRFVPHRIQRLATPIWGRRA